MIRKILLPIFLFVLFFTANSLAFDRQAILRYADQFIYNAEGREIYNTTYNNWNDQGGDCANFGSQCLRAGNIEFSDAKVTKDDKGCITHVQDLQAELKDNHGVTSGLITTYYGSDFPLPSLPIGDPIFEVDLAFYNKHTTIITGKYPSQKLTPPPNLGEIVLSYNGHSSWRKHWPYDAFLPLFPGLKSLDHYHVPHGPIIKYMKLYQKNKDGSEKIIHMYKYDNDYEADKPRYDYYINTYNGLSPSSLNIKDNDNIANAGDLFLKIIFDSPIDPVKFYAKITQPPYKQYLFTAHTWTNTHQSSDTWEGKVTIPSDAQNGLYTIEVDAYSTEGEQIDSDGNLSVYSPGVDKLHQFKIDTKSPEIKNLTPNGPTNKTDAAIKGELIDLESGIEGAWINFNNQVEEQLTIDLEGKFTYNIPSPSIPTAVSSIHEGDILSLDTQNILSLFPGNYTYSIRVKDKAGNEISEVVNFTIDITPPTILSLIDQDGKIINYGDLIIGRAVKVEAQDIATGIAKIALADEFNNKKEANFNGETLPVNAEFNGLYDANYNLTVYDKAGNIAIYKFTVRTTPSADVEKPGYNGDQPFIRSMAGGQVHITWKKPSVKPQYYELQFRKDGESWYKYLPGGKDPLKDARENSASFIIQAIPDDPINDVGKEGDLNGPNYYGFGVKNDGSQDLDSHYLIHVSTKNPSAGKELFYYSTNVANSLADDPNTYYYRIRSRVEDSYGSVKVSIWFPSDTGDSVVVNTAPKDGKPVYFYQSYQTLFETKTSYQFNFYFTPLNENNNLVSITAGYLVGKDYTNSYLISAEGYKDPYWGMLYGAFEKGGGSEEDKFNTSGIYSQVQDMFGELKSNVDGDNHISIVRLPIIGPLGYFSKINSHLPDENNSECRISNFREMIVIGLYEDEKYDPYIKDTVLLKGAIAHEFQHLIHHSYDSDEEVWVNEGCSGLAMDVCGYFAPIVPAVKSFQLKGGEVQLFPWDITVEERYGVTALWTMFLRERFGKEGIRKYVADPRNGRDAFSK